MSRPVMVMAGGTGGHVFPALAVAEALRSRGMEVFWLGARGGFESGVVPEHGFRMETISIRGLRGKGPLRLLGAPFRILLAMIQALKVLLRNRPGLVLGMGGFVSGPGGVMSRLLRIPLVVHEQNAIPGMTNQWLSRIASRVLEAFPGSFPQARAVELTGNPVRPEIASLPVPEVRFADREGPLRLLVLGGSQGAQKLNQTLPAALAMIDPEERPAVRHQTGRDKLLDAQQAYADAGVDAGVEPFIADMAEAYGWADLVLCRAGALTIAELAAAGVGSVLVPYPHAVDDHQTRNAAYLVDAGAALLSPEGALTPDFLARLLKEFIGRRDRLLELAAAARGMGMPSATQRVADVCQEAAKA